MLYFACYCRDQPGAEPARKAALAGHLAHVEANIDRYLVAGPLKEGEETVGSLLIIKASDADAARSFLETDPYFSAGVWESVSIDQFLGVAGDWVGGAAWKS